MIVKSILPELSFKAHACIDLRCREFTGAFNNLTERFSVKQDEQHVVVIRHDAKREQFNVILLS
jgi:hypothetical protein